MEQSTVRDRQSEHTSPSLPAWGDNEITYVDVPFSRRQLSNGPGLWFPPVRGILGSGISLKLELIDSKQVQVALNGKCYFPRKCGKTRGEERPRHIILLHIISAAWCAAFPFDVQPHARDDVIQFAACWSYEETLLAHIWVSFFFVFICPFWLV